MFLGTLEQKTSQKPELIIKKGEVESEGSSHNITYIFKNGNDKYSLTKTNVCGGSDYDSKAKSCKDYLEIEKAGKIISTDRCKRSWE